MVAIIDVPCTNATCTTTAANRLMIGVTDAASNGTISGSTVWTFFYFVGDPGSNFLDYPSLGAAAKLAIPTPDHYYPLIYTLGLKGKDDSVSFFNDKLAMGSVSMTSVKIS